MRKVKTINNTSNGNLQFVKLHPAAFLFASQMILLVVYAILDELEAGNAILSALSILALVLAVWVVNRSPAATLLDKHSKAAAQSRTDLNSGHPVSLSISLT